MVVKAGSTLLVPRGAHATEDVAEHLADHANLLLTPEGRPLRKLAFKAGKSGDTVAAVAKRYRVSADQVAQWNPTATHGKFKAGQTITVMTATAPTARKLADARTAQARANGKATLRKSGKPDGKTASRAGSKSGSNPGSKPTSKTARTRVAQAR
jgi:membrane-bound lytic murein transglycosylase D